MESVALRLAASAVSAILTKLGDKAAPYFGGDIVEDEVQHLQNIILPKIQTLLMVAEEAQLGDKAAKLKPWLRALQDAAYEAEDVLDMYEYKRLKAQVSSLPDLFKKVKKKAKEYVAPLCLKSELKKSFEKLQKSADEADKLNPLFDTISQIRPLRDAVQQRQQAQPTTRFPPPSSVFGRDKERDLLVDTLISTTDDEHSPVLAIWGIGGAGKTTLAQHVYNDSRVGEHFDKKMWAHVTREFDALKVTTKIMESATEGEGSSNITSLDALQMRLEKEISKSKKFLLVLDDVWCEDSTQWDQVLAPLGEALQMGSRILVTTRTQEVALKLGIENVVALEDLEYEHCMSIFKHYAFGGANKVIVPELATVAEQIMKKFKKSPLSARMVGSLLRGEKNVDQWNKILLKGEMLKDTLNTLYLSFDNLAPHLQQCFAYCGLYPKGYHFNKGYHSGNYSDKVDDLVKLWIAQGFVEAPKEDEMTMENRGKQYFDELVSKSFFQMERGSYYVIHDNLHELAEEVSKDHCFRIEDNSKPIPPTVRHLSIFCTKDLPLHILHTFKLENLRTFMVIELSKVGYDSIFQGKSEIFEKFKKLRVLDLGYNRLLLHKTIGQLKHIRYLQGVVEDVERLPKSLGRLYHLQFLTNLGKGEIISKIWWFGKLVSLRSIERYNASRKKGHEIGQLKNLRHLRGSLHIDNLENVRNKEEASDALLKEKKLLEELNLTWTLYSPGRDGRIDEKVIQGLEPPPNLNVLKIEGYHGVEFPEWLLNDGRFLRSLSELTIWECSKLIRVRSLPSTLKRLKFSWCLYVNEMPSLPCGLRVIMIEFCPNLMQLSPFPPSLEELKIVDCPGVETLLSNILVFEGEDEQPHEEDNQQQQQQQQHQHFSLKTLHIRDCSVSGKKRLFSDPNKLFTSLTTLVLGKLPWLTSLFHPDHKLTSLREIDIWGCENLKYLFGSPLASSPSLRSLQIRNCPRLTMPDMDGIFLPSSVEQLEFYKCGDPEMNLLGRCLLGLTPLKTLKIGGYSDARSLPDLPNPGAITDLRIGECPNLTSLLANMENLSSLRIWRCPQIELLPNLPPTLKEVYISDCHPQLEADYGRDGPLRHKLPHTTLVHI